MGDLLGPASSPGVTIRDVDCTLTHPDQQASTGNRLGQPHGNMPYKIMLVSNTYRKSLLGVSVRVGAGDT